jgi:hypothetical protein
MPADVSLSTWRNPLWRRPAAPPPAVPFGHLGRQTLASSSMPLLAAGGIVSWPMIGDGLAAGRAVPQEPGPVKSRRRGQAHAIVEREPSRVLDGARLRIQAQQRRDRLMAILAARTASLILARSGWGLAGCCGCCGCGLKGQEVGDAEDPQDLPFEGADAAPGFVVEQPR